jgi:DNA polymerase-3 subunit chi
VATDLGFYHCTRAPAGDVAVRLAAKAYHAGSRLLLVADPERLEALDRALWVDDPASFLPHGLAGGAHDPEQPILLAPEPHAANGATLLMLVERGLPADFDRFDRVFLLFDEAGPSLARARADWRAVAARDSVTRSYWQQTSRGGWEKKG